MKQIKEAFHKNHMILDLDATDIESAIRGTIQSMEADGFLSEKATDQVISALLQREQEIPTAIGHAIAVPHAYIDVLTEPLIIFVRLARPVNMNAPDGISTQFLFVLLGPPGSAARHLDTLANIARLTSDEEFRFDISVANTQDELLKAIDNFTARTTVPPKIIDDKIPEGLSYSGSLFGGIRSDVARRIPHYLSDLRDGMNLKCVSSTLFLFFACLAPAVTFGGVMAIQTGGQIGVIEMLLATSVCGVVYGLFSGQPLLIPSGTGPLLILTGLIFQLCSDLNIPFLPTYAWIGIWTSLILIILAVTEASCLMKYFTRFTAEIFSALISLIFIYEAIRSIMVIFQEQDAHKHHDIALLSLLLALGTFYIAMNLSRFRRSSYLISHLREFLADFGPTIALAAMTLISIWLHEVELDVLPIPNSFGTTNDRPWSVDLFAVTNWVRLAAIGPAILVSLLIFLNQNITAMLVNSSDHKLKKGSSYHYDLALIGIMVGVCSLFGLPWLVAAIVQSLNHVRSLATTENSVSKTGDRRERITHVRENRVTPLMINLLIGGSLLFLPLLRSIPMAVLYGLFLFMGVVSMSGNQLFERLSLWLKEPRLYPPTHYVRMVPIRTLHKFTFIQVTCLVVLWLVKSTVLGILFPLLIALLVPVRFLLNRVMDTKHLAILDASEEPEEEETHWAA
jgi:mannitol/fructose-specific phosphotransferase system IIA component (Ntr-type)